MNEKNFNYLKDHLKYMGFGESENVHATLREKIEQGAANFSLPFEQKYGEHEIMVCDLHFRRGEKEEMYFFNSYNATLRNDVSAHSQKIYLQQNGKGTTLKEAYNLLSGRAVHKEFNNSKGEGYKAWLQLDLAGPREDNGNYKIKQFHENYGFDLRSALSKAGVHELSDENSAAQLLRSLERGNLQSVTMHIGGSEIKAYVSANPQYKTINVYDQNHKPLRLTIGAERSTGQSSRPNDSVRMNEEPENKKKDQSVKPSTGTTPGDKKELLPRRQNEKKKGLSV